MTITELGVRVERDVPLTTRDGTILRSDVYRPAAAGRYPVLLGRTCYGKGSWGGWIEPERTAAEGWVVVINDTRGNFASDGEQRPFFHDAHDGYDTVEWCAAQEWSNGRVCTKPGAEEPNMPTLPLLHSCAAHHSTVS